MKPDNEGFEDLVPDSINNAKQGDEIWTFCEEGHIYNGKVLDVFEHPHQDKVYEVSTEHAAGGEKEYIPCSMAYATKEDATLAAITSETGYYAQFCENLLHSYLGEDPMSYVKEMRKTQPRFNVGDTVWFQEPNCEYNTHKGIVVAVKRIKDPEDHSRQLHLYTIDSRNEKSHKKYTHQLTDRNVFGSYRQSRAARTMFTIKCMAVGIPEWIQDMIDQGAQEAEDA